MFSLYNIVYTVFRNTIYFIWKLDLAPINLFIDTVVDKTVYNHDI